MKTEVFSHKLLLRTSITTVSFYFRTVRNDGGREGILINHRHDLPVIAPHNWTFA